MAGGLKFVMVATELLEHPKAQALEHRLDDERAAFYLVAVWLHVGRFYRDGEVPAGPDTERALERAARWRGEAGRLVAALQEIGFLDRTTRRGRELLSVHGWENWSGKYAARLDADRSKKRGARANKRRNAADSQAAHPEDVPRDVPRGVRGTSAPKKEKEKKNEKKPAAAERASARAGTQPGVQGLLTKADLGLLRKAEVGDLSSGGGVPAPPARPEVVAADDAPPRRPLLVEDRSELDELGASYRALVERELGHGLAGPKRGDAAGVRQELEQLLQLHGVQRAVDWTVNSVLARRQAGADEPGSVTWCLKLLRSMPEPMAMPERMAEIRAACPEWGQVLDAVDALPADQRLRQDAVERWLWPLEASFDDQALVLRAPDGMHRAFVEDNYLAGLERLAQEALGFEVTVELLDAGGPLAEAAS